MAKYIEITLILWMTLFSAKPAYPGERQILFKENFDNLENWRPLIFPKIKKLTSYTIETNANEAYLRAESNASASGIIYKNEFSVYEYSRVTWQWKIEHVYKRGDAKTKAGDDYPIRIYIVFKYDPEKAGFFENLKYKSYKLIYGEYPPHSSLNYIWANKGYREKIITNAYTERSKLILLQTGASNAGKWVTEEVDILNDYEKAFGNPPPPKAGIAIMNDSDNTAEAAASYVNFIEVYRPK
jgi:hypothetical protein